MPTASSKDQKKIVTPRTDHPVPTRDTFIDLTDPTRLMNRLLGENWAHNLFGFGDHNLPGADIEETDDSYTIEIELPGVTKQDVSIDVTGRRVAVHGERTERKRDGVLRHSTRSTGRFDYELTLPSAVETGEVSASLADGVLTMHLPKAKTERAKHITIS